jgi:superoxide dismutase, Cu-Zn family
MIKRTVMPEKGAMMTSRNILLAIGLVFLLAANASAEDPSKAYAELKDKDGKSIGTANLREQAGGVVIQLQVKGLSPGLHAIHVHAVGKCEAPAFASAGGHFNPAEKKHGLKNPDGPHAGDLPDLYVTKNGSGRYEALTDAITLKSGSSAIFDADGSAIVIHASADDNTSDPAGNSGDRIACGVITAGKAKR